MDLHTHTHKQTYLEYETQNKHHDARKANETKTNKQANKRTSKQAKEQASSQTREQKNKQTDRDRRTDRRADGQIGRLASKQTKTQKESK